jgi:hypothetical protein
LPSRRSVLCTSTKAGNGSPTGQRSETFPVGPLNLRHTQPRPHIDGTRRDPIIIDRQPLASGWHRRYAARPTYLRGPRPSLSPVNHVVVSKARLQLFFIQTQDLSQLGEIIRARLRSNIYYGQADVAFERYRASIPWPDRRTRRRSRLPAC